jgi:plastocyanin
MQQSRQVRRRLGSFGAALVLVAGMGTGLLVQAGAAAATSTPLVIGVDHADPANQRPDQGRVFEYTDFFSRSVRVHTGDIVNFRAAPASFHIIALAKSEQVARAVYPVATADRDDPNAPNGAPKVALGLSNFPITGGSTHGGGQVAFDRGGGPPVCGSAGAAPCTFRGGDDIEVAGPNPGFDAHGPAFADWNVHITARPGTYRYFCYIHPGMRGTLKVVERDERASTQAQVDAAAQRQFLADQAAGLAAERHANQVRFHGGAPGRRTYDVRVGVAAAQLHVAIDEMLPNRPLPLRPGDRVRYLWVDPHNVHTVMFPETNDLSPFGFDCGGSTGYSPAPSPTCTEPGEAFGPFPTEFLGDPGNARPGTVLTSPAAVVDSGVLFGTAYHVRPSVQRWSVATRPSATAPGAYTFHCTVHDWMAGTLNVS